MIRSFEPDSLMKNISLDDVIKLKLGRDRKSIHENLTKISYTLSDPNFSYSEIKERKVKNVSIFTTKSKNEALGLRAIEKSIKAIYQIKFSSKQKISKSLAKIISADNNLGIIRIDIKSFFESVNRKSLIEKLLIDALLSQEILKSLLNIDQRIDEFDCRGLPRGLAISSVLSELFLRDFDRKISNHHEVYFYARYVDDIIAITKPSATTIEDFIINELLKLGLSLNLQKKSSLKEKEGGEFQYLGYRFSRTEDKLKITFSDNKKKKVKTRIIRSIIDFGRNEDKQLLKDRIKFLSSNGHLYKNGKKQNLKSGIYYNNQLINDYKCLSELNEFLRKSITCNRGGFKRHLKSIDKETVKEILSYNFFDGFVNREIIDFGSDKLTKIKECWKDA